MYQEAPSVLEGVFLQDARAGTFFLRFLMRQPFAGTLDVGPLYIWCLRDAFVSGSGKTSP